MLIGVSFKDSKQLPPAAMMRLLSFPLTIHDAPFHCLGEEIWFNEPCHWLLLRNHNEPSTAASLTPDQIDGTVMALLKAKEAMFGVLNEHQRLKMLNFY